jgi:hypothetical protein
MLICWYHVANFERPGSNFRLNFTTKKDQSGTD